MAFRSPWQAIAEALPRVGEAIARGIELNAQQKQAEQRQSDLDAIARAQGAQQQNRPLYDLAFTNLQNLTPGTPEYQSALQLFQSYQPLFSTPTNAAEAQAILSGFEGLTGQKVTPMAAVPTDEFAAGGFLGTPAPPGPPRVSRVSPIEQLLGQSAGISAAAAERETARAAAEAAAKQRETILDRYYKLNETNFAALEQTGLSDTLRGLLSSPVTAESNAALDALVNYAFSVRGDEVPDLSYGQQLDIAKWGAQQDLSSLSPALASEVDQLSGLLGSGTASPQQAGRYMQILTGATQGIGITSRAEDLANSIVAELPNQARSTLSLTPQGQEALKVLNEFEALVRANPAAITPKILGDAQIAFSNARTLAGLPEVLPASPYVDLASTIIADGNLTGAQVAPILEAQRIVENPALYTDQQVAEAQNTIVSNYDSVFQANSRALLEPAAQDLLGTLQGFRTETTDPRQSAILDESIKTVSSFLSGLPGVTVEDFIAAQSRGLSVGASIGQVEDARKSARDAVNAVTSQWDGLSSAQRMAQYTQLAESPIFNYLTEADQQAALALTGIEDLDAVTQAAYVNAWDAYEKGSFGQVTTDAGRMALMDIFGVDTPEALDAQIALRRDEIRREREMELEADRIEFGQLAAELQGDRMDLISRVAETFSPEQIMAMRDRRPDAGLISGAAWDLMGKDGWNAAIAAAEARVLSERWNDPNHKAAYDEAVRLMDDRPETPEARAASLAGLEGLLAQTALSPEVQNAMYDTVASVYMAMDAGLEVTNANALLASNVAYGMIEAGFDPGYEIADYLRLNDAINDSLAAINRQMLNNDCRVREPGEFEITTRGSNADSPECMNLSAQEAGYSRALALNTRRMTTSEQLSRYFSPTGETPDGQIIRPVNLYDASGNPFQQPIVSAVVQFASLPIMDQGAERFPTVEEVNAFADLFRRGVASFENGVPVIPGDNGELIPIFGGVQTDQRSVTQPVEGNPDLVVADFNAMRGSQGAVAGTRGGVSASPRGAVVPELRLSYELESGGNSAAVNPREAAYGTYQFSAVGGFDSSGLGGFLRWLEGEDKASFDYLANALGVPVGERTPANVFSRLAVPSGRETVTDSAVQAWGRLASRGSYGELEAAYMRETYVEPVRDFLADNGVEQSNAGEGLIQVMADTRVQHGGNADAVFERAANRLTAPDGSVVGLAGLSEFLAQGGGREFAQAIVEERFKTEQVGTENGMTVTTMPYFRSALSGGYATLSGLQQRADFLLERVTNADYGLDFGPAGSPLFPPAAPMGGFEETPQGVFSSAMDAAGETPGLTREDAYSPAFRDALGQAAQAAAALIPSSPAAAPAARFPRTEIMRDLDAIEQVEARIEAAREPGTVGGALPQWPTRQEAYMMQEIFQRYGIDFDAQRDRQGRRWYSAYQELRRLLEGTPSTPAAGSVFDRENNPQPYVPSQRPDTFGANPAATTDAQLFDETGQLRAPRADMTAITGPGLPGLPTADAARELEALNISVDTLRRDYETLTALRQLVLDQVNPAAGRYGTSASQSRQIRALLGKYNLPYNDERWMESIDAFLERYARVLRPR